MQALLVITILTRYTYIYTYIYIYIYILTKLLNNINRFIIKTELPNLPNCMG